MYKCATQQQPYPFTIAGLIAFSILTANCLLCIGLFTFRPGVRLRNSFFGSMPNQLAAAKPDRKTCDAALRLLISAIERSYTRCGMHSSFAVGNVSGFMLWF